MCQLYFHVSSRGTSECGEYSQVKASQRFCFVTEEWVKARPGETIWEVKVEDLIREKK